MQHEGLLTGGGFFQPERSKFRELLACRLGRVDRQSTGRQSVDVSRSNGTKIACALKDGEFLIDALLLKLGPQAEARVSKRVVDWQFGKLVSLVEDAKVEHQWSRDPIFDHGNPDGCGKI